MVFKRSRIKGYLSTSLCLNNSGPALLFFIFYEKNNRFKSFSLFGLIAVGPADASFTGIKTVSLEQPPPHQLYLLNKL